MNQRDRMLASRRDRKKIARAAGFVEVVQRKGKHFVNRYAERREKEREALELGISRGWLQVTGEESHFSVVGLGPKPPTPAQIAFVKAAAEDKRWPKPKMGWGS